MRHDAKELGIAAALANRASRRHGRSARLRAASRAVAEYRRQDVDVHDVDVIDEAFAGFTRVDGPVPRDNVQATANSLTFPVRLTDCLSAQLKALDRQRSELVQLLRRIDQESQAN